MAKKRRSVDTQARFSTQIYVSYSLCCYTRNRNRIKDKLKLNYKKDFSGELSRDVEVANFSKMIETFQTQNT